MVGTEIQAASDVAQHILMALSRPQLQMIKRRCTNTVESNPMFPSQVIQVVALEYGGNGQLVNCREAILLRPRVWMCS